MDRELGMLRDFQTFLSQLGTVPENKTKFYIHWVRRFVKFCNYQLESSLHNLNHIQNRLKARFEIINDYQLKACNIGNNLKRLTFRKNFWSGVWSGLNP